MKKHLLYLFFYVILFSFFSTTALAQDSTVTRLKQLVASLNKHKEVLPGEQIYLQTDKPYYAVDDTLWLKAYVLNPDLAYSDKSGVVYLEFLNDSSRLVKRVMLPVKYGIGWGSIALHGDEFIQGAYTLRCYTNWQRNFNEQHFYTKNINIGSSSNKVWLINSAVARDKQQVNAHLQFRKLDQLALGLQDLRIKVYHGRHELYSQKMTTKIDGKLDVNFLLPDKVTGDLTIKAESAKAAERQSVIIPLQFALPNDIDLQFMPEGGALVGGLPTQVAFKALDPDGLSANVYGKIYDSKQHEAGKFNALHKGMGVFSFQPASGESYTASFTLPDGTNKIVPLPAVQQSGTVMNIGNDVNTDSLILTLRATPDKVNSSYMLIGHAREMVCYAATLQIGAGKLTRKVAKDLFPTGITRFTLLDSHGKPLNERLVFIDHHDSFNVNLTPNQHTYHPGDSIAFKIKVTDIKDMPVNGSFSIAVTDDDQLKPNENRENILTAIMLNSGIKGIVEEPGYYLDTKNPEVWKAMDALLLAQGWTSYNWKQMSDQNFKPLFAPEKEFVVQGKVTNVFGKPVSNGQVVLFSTKPIFFADTLTDAKGIFRFSNLSLSDTVAYKLQSRNKNGKSFNVGITVDEFKAPAMPVYKNNMLPWYVNGDSSFTHYIRSVNRQQQFDNYNIPRGTNVLKEVHIKAKKVIKDSKNLNGPGQADFALDQKDLEKAGKKTLLELFEERLPGFHIAGRSGPWYFIHEEPLYLIVDGIALHKTIIPLEFDDVRTWLASTSAEDVKGIEEIYSNGTTYEIEYFGKPAAYPVAFVEVTTRYGKGPNIPVTPGTYLYKPMSFVSAKEFYRPKYLSKNSAALAGDTRSTIHWDPNIVTGTNGEATVSFYAAGKPGTYTYIIEGSDLNGNIGYKTGKIIVK